MSSSNKLLDAVDPAAYGTLVAWLIRDHWRGMFGSDKGDGAFPQT